MCQNEPLNVSKVLHAIATECVPMFVFHIPYIEILRLWLSSDLSSIDLIPDKSTREWVNHMETR